MVTTGERKSKEERREEILDAALAVFAEHGLDGSSTEDVARRAGVPIERFGRCMGRAHSWEAKISAMCFT